MRLIFKSFNKFMVIAYLIIGLILFLDFRVLINDNILILVKYVLVTVLTGYLIYTIKVKNIRVSIRINVNEVSFSVTMNIRKFMHGVIESIECLKRTRIKNGTSFYIATTLLCTTALLLAMLNHSIYSLLYHLTLFTLFLLIMYFFYCYERKIRKVFYATGASLLIFGNYFVGVSYILNIFFVLLILWGILLSIVVNREYLYSVAMLFVCLIPTFIFLDTLQLEFHVKPEFFATSAYIILCLGVIKDLFYELFFETEN